VSPTPATSTTPKGVRTTAAAGRPPAGRAVGVVVVRQGRLPAGADEAVAEAGGLAVVVGSGAEEAAGALLAAGRSWWHETGDGFRPGALAALLAPVLAGAPLVVLPASPDGRDLAPRLAAELDVPLVAQSLSVRLRQRRDGHDGRHATPAGPGVEAELGRLDDRVVVPVGSDGPVVATLVPGVRTVERAARRTRPRPLDTGTAAVPPARDDAPPEAELLALVEPDPATMDLADAGRVLGGGAGLVAGLDDGAARHTFELLVRVSAALGASAGATRVATDAGWTGYERQIGTTGVAVDPELYVALGVSGASQHVGGLGRPRHVVSVNRDPSCPMTAMADLGLVTDARGFLEELGRRLGVAVDDPPEVDRAR